MADVDVVPLGPVAVSPEKIPRPAAHKIAVGAVGGAATIVIVWVLRYFWGVDMPAEVSQALTILVSTGLSTMVPDEMEA